MTSRAPTGTRSRCAPAGTRLGAIAVWIPKGRRLRPSDTRLLTALSEQAAVAFRNVAMESQLAGHVAELDHTTRELSASRSRIIEADDAARRTLEEAISREVLPRLITLPGELVSARHAVALGSPANGVDLLVAATNDALESLRELTRGVFPTQLARSGVEPALRSLLARNGLASALQVGAVRGRTAVLSASGGRRLLLLCRGLAVGIEPALVRAEPHRRQPRAGGGRSLRR